MITNKINTMNKIWLIFALISLMLGTASCSKDDDKEGEVEETDIVGAWVATSGGYDLSLDVTSTGYNFMMGKPGKGGVTDSGTYEISNDGKIIFENKSGDVLAMGYLKNENLTLTFVNSMALIMLGNGAGNVVFTLENGEGYIVIQNLSASNNIVALKFYDGNNKLINTDTDVLEPDYQFTYDEVPVGTYLVEATDSKGKSYKTNSFKVIKDKYSVLEYTGSALKVVATGVNESDFSRSAMDNGISHNTKQERIRAYN